MNLKAALPVLAAVMYQMPVAVHRQELQLAQAGRGGLTAVGQVLALAKADILGQALIVKVIAAADILGVVLMVH